MRIGLALGSLLITYGCTAPVDGETGATLDEEEDAEVWDAPRVEVELVESDEDMLNPERGFYSGFDLLAPAGADLRGRGHTLALSLVRLDNFRDRPLDRATLDGLEAGFEAARAAGIKVILRFAYNAAFDADAPKSQILMHIEQLEPVLRANADVISVMQAGFIGAWGEWHSSQNGLDNDADRTDILNALLAALPSSRSVQVRTPMFKEAAFGEAIDSAEAWSGSFRARVGHHNDCFLASEDDLGTYAAPVDDWRTYVALDSRFAPTGGETCQVYPPRTQCQAAIDELSELHWSYLNREYQTAVIDGWIADGCEPEIRKRLGYRLAATEIRHTEVVRPGGVLRVEVDVVNNGFAAPFNSRPVYVVLDGPGGRHPLRLGQADPRRWRPGTGTTISARLEVPENLEPGDYSVALWLPDADERLSADPRYAIRLANADSWDQITGDNVLSRNLRVEP